jgi:hypothetical protein
MKKRASGADFVRTVNGQDIAVVQSLIGRSKDTDFFRERRVRNVSQPPPEFSCDEFWRVLVGCLLTTRQRSTKGSPVDRFLETKAFPLRFNACKSEPSIQRFALKAIESFGRIRFGTTISRRAAENWKRLDLDSHSRVRGTAFVATGGYS